MPDACTTTVTGLVWLAGRTMSGGPENVPNGLGGADTPPTEAMTSWGEFGALTGLGSDVDIG